MTKVSSVGSATWGETMKRPAVAAILISLIPLTVQSQPTAGERWHWIWVEPSRTGWAAIEGDAPVRRSGNRFVVTLDGAFPDRQGSLKLVGAIAGTRVSAVGTLLDTDAEPERYTGTIQRERSKLTDPANGWGSDRMMLHTGPTFVGLYRTVRSKR